MNFNSMKKDEVVDWAQEAEKTLNDQKNLAKVVEKKDEEISKLQEKIRNKNEELSKKEKTLKEQKHLAKAVESKDKEIAGLKQVIKDLKAQHEQEKDNFKNQSFSEYENKLEKTVEKKNKEVQDKQKEIENLKKIFEDYDKTLNQVLNFAKGVMDNNTSFLKSVEGSLDIAVKLAESTNQDWENIIQRLRQKD